MEILQDKMKIKVFLVVLKFFIVGALFIISNGNLYLSKAEDFVVVKDLYVTWLGNSFNYLGQIAGYVIHSRWLPG